MLDSLVTIFWASIGLLEDVGRAYEGAVAVAAALAAVVIYAVLRRRPRKRLTAPARPERPHS